MQHTVFMQRAIELAEKGRYKTAPNPCVGAVLVHKNKIIAEGYHEACGMAHAEVACLCNALEQGIFYREIQNNSLHFSNPFLQEKLEACRGIVCREHISIKDCVLYVTLEPCNHYGKTPPCSAAVYEAGIKTVYIGCLDPNPKAQGGMDFLREKGVSVHSGLCEKECRDLIADFLVWQKEKRPFCIVKMASTLDGKIGPALGHSHAVSGKESKKTTMLMRRNMAVSGGAVMVGSRTFFEDNPKLTVRDAEANTSESAQPLAFVVSKHLPEIENGKTGFYCLDERKKTVIFTSLHTEEKKAEFEKIGICLEYIDKNIDNTINLKKVFETAFQKYHCPYIYCEGGAHLAQALLKEGLADRLILYLAPTVLGDDTAKNVFSGNSVLTMQEAYRFSMEKFEKVGEDLHIYLKTEKTCSRD